MCGRIMIMKDNDAREALIVRKYIINNAITVRRRTFDFVDNLYGKFCFADVFNIGEIKWSTMRVEKEEREKRGQIIGKVDMYRVYV